MQLVLHEFKFNNIFAYGDGNHLTLDTDRVTQIIGPNGSGKSSIPGALEELFYNKNSRGVKKASVKNRKADSYSISAKFSIGTDRYTIEKTVKSSAKVILTKNGEDISGHTATLSYKTLEKEIGLDFSTFSKLVYQSMKSSLDFLSATDTNRKKFLIGLLGLEKYADIEEQLKKVSREVSDELSVIEGSIQTTRAWLGKNKTIPDIEPLIEVPDNNEDLVNTVAELRAQENGVVDTNKRIANAKRQVSSAETKQLSAQKAVDSLGVEPAPAESKSSEIQEITRDLSSTSTTMDAEKNTYQRFKDSANKTSCHTCGSHLDTSEAEAARDAAKERWLALQPKRDELQELLNNLKAEEAKCKTYEAFQTRSASLVQALESANDYLLEIASSGEHEQEEVSVEDIQAQIRQVNTEVRNLRNSIDKAIEQNTKAEVNNAKRDLVLEQLQDRKEELQVLEEKFNHVSVRASDYKILVQAFGAKGLVAYKIESSIKALEETLNSYLSVLTAGQFAIGFQLSGTKLDVVVYDGGELVEINALSSGEFANVQISTLLAIRKILSALNSVEINVLFLDEVISVIDGLGRDRLIELLLEETELNTFLVSHEYTHPLAEKLYVVKEDGFSHITKEI